MKTHISCQTGLPLPWGSSITPDGINFTLFSRHAEAVYLIVKPDRNKPDQVEIPLDPHTNKTGDIWHVLLRNVSPELLSYGYRVFGPYDPEGEGHAYNPQLVLLDPCSREIASPAWGIERSCLGQEPCCLVDLDDYDWEGDRPLNIPLAETVIYELHVRGFTQHPSSGVACPGTFKGIIEKIDYLRELGITAVELMPITDFNENEALFVDPESGEHLKNFWGYNPLSFFAPKGGYSSNPDCALYEFRDMVKALHKAGIEVILDVVFNHTAEGNLQGPTTSLRGIDNSIYYLLDAKSREYLNFSGCGNTCNCNHPVLRNLILHALRWWVVWMHVDGFRFDLASILGRDKQGNVLPNPPVVEQIAEDPVLAKTKIIAEAWDAAGLYQVGSFSSHRRWAEWNGRFRDDVRSFMCGHPDTTARLATRISGNADLYQNNDRTPCNSINFITSHDGFTLADLVSYNEKHNNNNGENNQDGDNHNISWNSGIEGPTKDQTVLNLRSRRARTMMVILMLSQGVPMVVAGDEIGRSQRGNNNAWCQDNAISWLDWSLVRTNRHLLRFFCKLVTLRKTHSIFRRESFFPPPVPQQSIDEAEIFWWGRSGEQNWAADEHFLAFFLRGSAPSQQQRVTKGNADFFVMINGHASETALCTVPPAPKNRHWVRLIDTSQPGPADFLDLDRARRIYSGTELTVANMACTVLQSVPGGRLS